LQLSVIAKLVPLPTVVSQLRTELPVDAPQVPTKAADVVVEVGVLVAETLTDTAVVLLRKNRNHETCPKSQANFKCFFSDSEKQAGHGWGANEAGAELADEQAGEAIAKSDEKDGGDASADAEKLPEVEAEPEDNSISYSDYLAQQAEKKLSLGSSAPALRKANEGSKEDKKWANAKELAKQEEEAFIEGSGPKAKRERERKAKQVVEIDQRFVEAPERGGRGEGRGRGGRGRGDGARGGRGEFRGRGDGFRGRGEGRGGRGRGDGAPRGAPRGGPRGGAAPINTEDTKAFPSLGS
jgi:plasminogen activator inhibitor 1 RNA-binding protein